MVAKLARLTHKIAIQLHLVAESCTICSSHSRRPVRKLLYTPSYTHPHRFGHYILWYLRPLMSIVRKSSNCISGPAEMKLIQR
jgi:hypothetical protein